MLYGDFDTIRYFKPWICSKKWLPGKRSLPIANLSHSAFKIIHEQQKHCALVFQYIIMPQKLSHKNETNNRFPPITDGEKRRIKTRGLQTQVPECYHLSFLISTHRFLWISFLQKKLTHWWRWSVVVIWRSFRKKNRTKRLSKLQIVCFHWMYNFVVFLYTSSRNAFLFLEIWS